MVELKTGGCVCGRIRYQVVGEPKRVTLCHCRWCQQRTGTGFGTEVVFDVSQITINDDLVSRYRHVSDESDRWLEQHFCSECGSNIGITLEAVPDIRTIAAGTFDNPAWLRSDQYKRRHVFTRSAQDWVLIPDNVESYEEHFR